MWSPVTVPCEKKRCGVWAVAAHWECDAGGGTEEGECPVCWDRVCHTTVATYGGGARPSWLLPLFAWRSKSSQLYARFYSRKEKQGIHGPFHWRADAGFL